MKMKRYLPRIVCALCAFILFPILQANAASNTLHEIDIKIVIAEDGSAEIAEKWHITVGEGTEIYKEMNNMGDSSVRDFIVMKGDKQFETLDNWDINASREVKAYKAGIVKNGHDYELCFGVGEYGENEYTMNYTIDNFVAKYQDVYGMNWRLVNEAMNTAPEAVKIDISGHGITEDTQMYAFGFEGFIELETQEGITHVVAGNVNDNGAIGRVAYVNILMSFPESTFASAITKYSNRTFSDIVEEAKEGSDYDEKADQETDKRIGIFPVLVAGSAFAGPVIMFALCLFIKGFARSHSKGSRAKALEYVDGITEATSKIEANYFRDIPCNNDLYFFYNLCVKTGIIGDKEARSGLITGVLLNWIRKNHVEFVKEEKKTLFSSKDIFKIHFQDSLDPKDELDCKLYGFFKRAAGKNDILENKEFERWCAKNYQQLDSWFSSVESQVRTQWAAEGYTQTIATTQKFLFLFDVPVGKVLYTPKFREEVHHSVGFKKFLLEFGNLGEKQVKEVRLWESYLIFASILGIADKVEKEIGKMYPEFSQQSNLDITYTTFATRAFVYSGINRAASAKSAANSSTRSSGGGGGVR